MADELIPPSRRDRLHVRRAWRRRLAIGGVSLVAAMTTAAGAMIALDDDSPTDASSPPSDTTSAISGATSASSPVISGPRGEIDRLPKGRALSHDDPLRLWIGGDSLSGAIGPVIGQLAEDSGVVAALVDFKVSSGLATSVRDWPEYATELLQEHDPEAIVFMVGANDAIVVNNDRASWEPDYRAKVREMMDLLVGTEQRTVFWVGSPPMRLGDREEGIIELNRVYKEEALLRDEVVYIDAYTMFEGPEGGYSSSIFIPGRGTLYVRSGDGVHFNNAGAEWLGYNVWQLIDQRWDVGEYAEPDLPIDFRTEPGGNTGCCEEPGQTVDTEPVGTTTTAPCTTDTTCETTTSSAVETTTTIVEETTTTVPPTDPTTTTTAPPPST